jgi:hypothetical protein
LFNRQASTIVQSLKEARGLGGEYTHRSFFTYFWTSMPIGNTAKSPTTRQCAKKRRFSRENHNFCKTYVDLPKSAPISEFGAFWTSHSATRELKDPDLVPISEDNHSTARISSQVREHWRTTGAECFFLIFFLPFLDAPNSLVDPIRFTFDQ